MWNVTPQVFRANRETARRTDLERENLVMELQREKEEILCRTCLVLLVLISVVIFLHS